MACIKPPPEILEECMKKTSSIRNVCILAHVDHGKTTIADSLLVTNRLVSKRMAGLIRYLDDRPDEQERGITMKSSAVSLLNLVEDDETDTETPLFLNLIDTPGHIDFSSEVGAALRICDGALIAVDLVEGVCVQSREAIKLAFSERCKMILLLNKVDKLIVELHKEVDEIFQTIIHTIENCNAIIAELYQYEYGKSDVDIENTGLLFSPEQGNVIFCSALDGWGFTTKQLSKMFLKVTNNETLHTLNEKLWNFDAYLDSKSKTIKTGAIEKGKTNLFTQLILKTVYHIYHTIVLKMQRDKVSQIAEKLNVVVNTREIQHNDPKIQLKAIMQAWCPLAEVILLQCIKIINPPSQLSIDKIKYFLDYERFCENDIYKPCLNNMVKSFQQCSSDNNAPIIICVSKMFCTDIKNLSQNKPKLFIPKPRDKNKEETAPAIQISPPLNSAAKLSDNGDSEENQLDFSIIALARVFSGTLNIGQDLYVLSPQYLPNEKNEKHYQKVIIKELYMLFGRDLLSVDSVPAGNVCGISGLESAVLRTATLSSTLESVPFIEHPSPPPIVRNTLEPVNPKELPILRQGLKTLIQSDSCVQVMVQETGEHVLITAGDVHLAKCLEDLTTKFAKIQLNVSSPMVSLRETVITDVKKGLDNIVIVEVPQFKLSVSVVHLPNAIVNTIEKNYKLLKSIEEFTQITGFELFKKQESKTEQLKEPYLKTFKSDATNVQLKYTRDQLNIAFKTSKGIWSRIENNIWSIGNMSNSINLLINYTHDYKRNLFQTLDETDPRSCFDYLIVNAFNSCCKSGPLCEEPLKNCAFFIKNFEITQTENLDSTMKSNANIESTLCNAFREAFEKQQTRLMEPMFTTSIQVNTNILGKVYSVVNRRHGKVLDAVGMDEQEKSFFVKAQIPVVESTGFANEMRKTTSGQAMPTLKFSHFGIIDGDPFYNPEDEEENENIDDVDIEAAVRATKLRKTIRKRKGLNVEEQVVTYGAKQRTLNRKK